MLEHARPGLLRLVEPEHEVAALCVLRTHLVQDRDSLRRLDLMRLAILRVAEREGVARDVGPEQATELHCRAARPGS